MTATQSKKTRTAAGAVLAALCLMAILAAGCTDAGTNGQTSAAANSLSTSGTAAKSSFDPIVGVWKSPGTVYKFSIAFDVNGKTQETYSNVPAVIYNGTWQSAGDNMYLVTRDTGEKTVWTLNPSGNTISKREAPGVVYSLDTGTSVGGRSSGLTASGSSIFLSGTGDAVTPFAATESGLWIFSMQYSGESNFIVWLKDANGKRLVVLANEIGTYSGVKPQTIDAGKYYLDVTASGPWTVRASVS